MYKLLNYYNCLIQMVRNYIKKTNRGRVSEDIYKNAAAEVLSKEVH